MKACPECYGSDNRATPILNKKACLSEHMQYICGTCGRCICIAKDSKRNLARWNFPFKSLEIAKLYLRAADFSEKHNCGIYEIISQTGRKSYKIFPTKKDFMNYLEKNNKQSSSMATLFQEETYLVFPNTEVRKLTKDEIVKYLQS
ncbi:hypothetical protein [Enterococcus sp. AZ103]|uniref:hypothetical protein n=1 Tax=Enterococcus sp. AZ103 TaxID=2774628 RepID=UPI003F22310C